MKEIALIVTDSGPLITLGVARALETLLLLKLPVIIPDMVRHEVIRDLTKPGAGEVAEWLRATEGRGVMVASTQVFEEFEILRKVNPATKTNNRGEQAAAEVLSREFERGNTGAILLFEDSGVRKANFLIRLPDEVVVISTSEFLYGLESQKLVKSARDILARAVDIRGNNVLTRHVRSSTDDEEAPSWSTKIKRIGPK